MPVPFITNTWHRPGVLILLCQLCKSKVRSVVHKELPAEDCSSEHTYLKQGRQTALEKHLSSAGCRKSIDY